MDITGTIFRVVVIVLKAIPTTIIIFMLVAIFNLLIQALYIGINKSVLMDVVVLIQMWLPFNLGTIIVWLFAIATAYFGYIMAVKTLNIINSWIQAD